MPKKVVHPVKMTVELSVEHGLLSIIAADTQGLTITDNGDGKLVISGDIDKINTLAGWRH